MPNISKEVNIEMLEKLEDGTFLKKNPATKADVVEETAEKQFVSATDKASWEAKVDATYLNEIVKTPVPANAVFTDTKYVAGNNITIEGNVINATGGGGGTGASVIRLEPITKPSFNFAYGGETIISYNFSSSMTSLGTATYYIDGLLRATQSIKSGVVEFDLGPYLKRGNNTVEVRVSDVFGGRGSFTLLGIGITLQISSIFDDAIVYPGDIDFRFTAFGSLQKTVFIEINGVIKHQIPVSTNGVQRTQKITSLPHGGHTLRVYSEAAIEGAIVRSNILEYTVVATDAGRQDVIIATSFEPKDIDEGELISIPYKIYKPLATTVPIQLLINNEVVSELSVGRALQHWNISSYPTGDVVFTIQSENVSKSFEINIKPSELDIEATTADMRLMLTSEGRSNAELNRDEWTYEDTAAVLTGFNYINNGWVSNDKGETVLRLSGDSRVEIPFNLFETDAKSFGSTIDMEFTLRNVSDYSANIISCFSENIGIEINGRGGKLSTQLMNDTVSKALSVNFKEDEKIRLSFVIEPRSANRLIYIYLNGIVSAIYQYDMSDSFTQENPVGISIGSRFADVDIYSIRSYDAALTANQILNNYIADTRILSEKMNLYLQNRIFDDFSNVDYGAISNQLPALTIIGQLPIAKGTKVSSTLLYKNAFDSSKDFYYEHIPGRSDKPLLDVQGTSSQYYPRKNFKMVFPEWYKLRDDSISETTFTFKADYMDSSHALNTGLARLINRVLYEVSPLPPQKEFPNIRHSIDGFPIVLFHQENESSERICLGAYNFNNDKGNAATFGYTALAEQWEGKDNSAGRTNFTSWDDPDRDIYDDWEGRFKETDTTNLDRLGRWIVSTKDDPVKFKAEYKDYIDLDAFLSYFIIVEFFGMVDSLAKNMFLATWDGDLWYPIFYDIDTAIGLNNEGHLIFSYNIEKDDVIGTQNVWNGKNSTLWNNIVAAFPDELETMYNRLRAAGLNYEEITKELIGGQIDKIPAALYNYDSQYKYIDPLINDGNGTYLYIAQGSRENHIKWWLQNRIEYLDSKYKARDYQDDFIAMRLYSPSGDLAVPLQPNFDITLSDDQYVAVRYGSIVQTVRGTTKEVVTINAPGTGAGFNDTETVIYGASKISDIGDLAGKYVGTVDVSSATKLTRLIAGSPVEGYVNTNLSDVTVGNNKLLKEIDVRNCPNLNKVLNLANANNIEYVYATGTSIPAVTFPVGGILKTAHLPGSIVSLNIQGQKSIEDFQVDSYANIRSLRIENSVGIDVQRIIDEAPLLNRVRLIDVDFTFDDIEALIKISKMAGMDENNNDIPQAVMTGKARVTTGNQQDLRKLQSAFPELEITVDNMISDFTVTFVDWDGQTLDVQDLLYGQYPVDPTARSVDSIDIPTRAPHELFNYFFSGWEPFDTVQQTAVIKAKYITDYVLAKFLNWDGSLYHTQVVKYGEAPYDPVAEGDVLVPTRPTTNEFIYTFSNWIGDFSPITDHVEFTAEFSFKALFTLMVEGQVGTILTVSKGEDFTDQINALTSEDLNVPAGRVVTGWSKTEDFSGSSPVITNFTEGTIGQTLYAYTEAMPEGYILATDADFRYKEEPSTFKPNTDGYIGEAEKIVLPMVIHGKGVQEFENIFKDTMVEGVSYTPGRNGPSSANINNFFRGTLSPTLDLSSFNTSNVTSMYGMFYDSAATSLDLSNFDTSNVTDMGSMFYGSSATTLDLSGFDTGNVTDMDCMFSGSAATEIDVSSFDTSNVNDMASMFFASPATTLDLSSFNTSNVTDMSSMFAYSSAIELDLSNFDTSSVTNMGSMFAGNAATTGYAKTQADADRFNASSDKPAKLTFIAYVLATDADFEFVSSSATNAYYKDGVKGYFKYTGTHKYVIIPDVIQGVATPSYYRMFYQYSGLQLLGVANQSNSNVTDMSFMFYDCGVMKSLDLRRLDTSNVTDMRNMFYNSRMKTLNLSSFDTSKVSNMGWMFYRSRATTLDLSSFDTSNVAAMDYMFQNASAGKINLSSFDTSNVTDMSHMFDGSSVRPLDLSSFNTSNVTNMTYMFASSSADKINLSSFDTSNVTNMSFMFFKSSMNPLDLSSFDTSSVTNINGMFASASSEIGYARTQADANKFTYSPSKPATLRFVVKP